jgi:hypothetical protein
MNRVPDNRKVRICNAKLPVRQEPPCPERTIRRKRHEGSYRPWGCSSSDLTEEWDADPERLVPISVAIVPRKLNVHDPAEHGASSSHRPREENIPGVAHPFTLRRGGTSVKRFPVLIVFIDHHYGCPCGPAANTPRAEPVLPHGGQAGAPEDQSLAGLPGHTRLEHSQPHLLT